MSIGKSIEYGLESAEYRDTGVTTMRQQAAMRFSGCKPWNMRGLN